MRGLLKAAATHAADQLQKKRAWQYIRYRNKSMSKHKSYVSISVCCGVSARNSRALSFAHAEVRKWTSHKEEVVASGNPFVHSTYDEAAALFQFAKIFRTSIVNNVGSLHYGYKTGLTAELVADLASAGFYKLN